MKDRNLELLGVNKMKQTGKGKRELREGTKFFTVKRGREGNSVAFTGSKEIKERTEEVKFL